MDPYLRIVKPINKKGCADMKQNIQKYFGNRLFVLQFHYCEQCKYFKSCYERTGRPDLISEECIDEDWIRENIEDCKDKN